MADGTEPIVGKIFDVFISYAREDVKELIAVIDFLEKRGYTVDLDVRLVAGQDWQEQLRSKIKRARKVVALWSEAASLSEVVHWEMSIADGDKKLVPLWLDDTDPKGVFGKLHHLKITDFETEEAAILEALGIEPTGDKPTPPGPSKRSADDIWLEGLPTGTRHLFGRDVELTTLLDAWASGGTSADAAKKTNAVVLHAIGGAGKSALLRRFLDALEEKGFPGAAKVYGWSAYSQGSGDNRNADADGFISRALKFFGHDLAKEPITDPVERGRILAKLVRKQHTLLVLDGLEPLQDLPHVNEGRLKDRGLQALVTQLAKENPGLLVITSRQELPELAAIARPPAGKPADKRVINHALDNLDERAGAELLKHLGVHGREKELMAAVKEVGGHALSVSLLGTYLSAACAGDVARRDTLRFHDLVDKQGETPHDRQAKRATRIMDAYVERFEALPKDETGAESLILSLVGLFDRPAEPDALAAVLAAPPIPALTDRWHALDDAQQKLRWTFALKRLRALKLISAAEVPSPSARVSPPPRGEGMGVGGHKEDHASVFTPPLTPPRRRVEDTPSARWEGDRSAQVASGDGTLDAHPVVRQHFGRRLKEDAPNAFREANRRLYEHYKALPEKLYGKELPDTLEEMQPLFSAIAHGCAAGLHQDVFNEVHFARLYRRNEKYLVHKLGGLSADLGALAHFFDPPWGRPHPSLGSSDQSVALNFAGYALRALGRLREAVEPNAEAARRFAASEDWKNAASGASTVSELLLTLGDVGPAVAAARESVTYADKSGEAFRRMGSHTTLAHALHEAGDARAAAALFAEAERLQKELQPELPRLYSVQGYKFCDLLLSQGRYLEVAERAGYAIKVAKKNNWLLDISLDTLSLGRAAHQAWRASPSPRVRGEGRGEGQRHTPSPAQVSAPHPIPLPAEERGEGATARRHLDAAVEGLRKAGAEHHIPRGLLARAAFRRDTGAWDKAQEDLAETHEIASRGGMRLFLADYHLERARLLLAQIPGVTPPDEWTLALARAGADAPTDATARSPSRWFKRARSMLGGSRLGQAERRPNTGPSASASVGSSLPLDPTYTLTDAHRALIREANQAWTEANTLIQTTGYHRRDGELAALRDALDVLAP